MAPSTHFRFTLLTYSLLAACLKASSISDPSFQQLTFNDPSPHPTSGKPSSTKLPSFQAVLDESLARSVGKDQLGVLSLENLKSLHQHIASLPERRRLRWADGHEEWLTEGEKALVMWYEKGRRFVDVTDQPEESHAQGFVSSASPVTDSTTNQFPTVISHGSQKLANVLKDIEVSRMQSRLAKFTHFRTRYYRSSSGQESQKWLLELINELVSASPSNVTVSEFTHPWGQNSIIARFEPHPASDDTSLESCSTFVVGAHQDSTNLLPFLPAPGADDDGSGTISILEAFTILLKRAWSPAPNQGAVEFMWFSAEEGGLLGSQAIANSYHSESRNIRGMVQFDMTAFVKAGSEPNIGLVTDFVDDSLTEYLRLIIDEYLTVGWVNTKCGYACSDHASWSHIGVPSAFAIESTFKESNPYIHSINDKFDFPEFSFEHMAQFSRLVLGLVVELGGNSSAVSK
ncbi:hypothetical protein CROQUDRAFT_129830 [Cronartium quercuum f. sp. fusiforme G11]|uniref:Peptide hydrolase n=1 Tax=Cronartium quercuum f. sp. fusiforme G11 TaxID=708437 RepID=A0A9P6NTI5_9BASI|nr:hypothetical protein CROQUDRAFT_129830 [Cronartium quercuum f. sp. fusiforme G11]